ncbi:MAG: shikimate kinase [Bacteroidetes bacterium]|nr:shikimate kinase [Bacteroidota bacterium]MDA0902836.1 shikimate kinase [Bacteroidota bacterium]MDA1242011.1 shikimate kinase [Bacteroidota bacterium]
MHVVLIGFMGSGKSTLGQRLADELGRSFADTDRMVEDAMGMSVAELFQTRGEQAFRDAEQEALSEALRPSEPIVLATGGGTPCAEGAMEWMRRRALVVHLKPPLEVLLERLEGTVDQRPLLRGKTGKELGDWVQRLLLTRAACYGAAHVVWSQDLSSEDAFQDAVAGIRWRLDPEW